MVCRVYGWEEKKSKASWGGSTEDYGTIAEKAVREVNTQEVQHFLVVCVLASAAYEGLESCAHRRPLQNRHRKTVRGCQ